MLTSFHITGIATYGYFLVLNPMMSNAETKQEFGPFNSRDEARRFYDSEKVEPYQEEAPDMFNLGQTKTYRKTFRKGGALEWMNPLDPHEWEAPGLFGHGLHEVVIEVTNIVKGAPA